MAYITSQKAKILVIGLLRGGIYMYACMCVCIYVCMYVCMSCTWKIHEIPTNVSGRRLERNTTAYMGGYY
jgi:hypothetical protein